MSPAPINKNTASSCAFKSSMFSVRNMWLPGINAAKSSIVNSPAFSRAEPKISHK